MELPAEALAQLNVFVNVLKMSPNLLHKPELSFFKEFIESFGGKVPAAPSAGTGATKNKPEAESGDWFANKPTAPPPPAPEEESEESDVELDNTGVIEPDTAEPLPEYKPVEVPEEDVDKSNEKKIEAISAYQEGELEKAFKLYSEAITANPNSALLYAKRAQCNLKRNKPNACIQDCSRAILINPDCAPAYKYRGRANRLLGQWQEAVRDLRNACKIDFDEEADEWLREVTPNARKLEEHQRKYERKHAEKELRERTERVKRAREEHAKAAKEAAATQQQQQKESTKNSNMKDIFSLMNDPEISAAFLDPEVAAAFQDISSNPANILKYQDNPKIISIIEKVKSKYGKMAGGAGMGGYNPFGFAPFSAPPPPPPPPSSGQNNCADDVGLD